MAKTNKYKIHQRSLKKAKELGLIIKPSSKKYKKIDVFCKNGRFLASIGDKRYNDYPTYLEMEKRREIGKGEANRHKERYNKRFAKAMRRKCSPAQLNKLLLWS